MLNRTPSNSSNVINSYRKRRMQKGGPFLVYGAVALVIIGAIMLVIWLSGPGKPLNTMFATETPTATLTATATLTNTPTVTPTVTITPTITITSTPTGDQSYVIQEGDSLESIAQKFNLGDDGSQIIYFANQETMEAQNGVIYVGQSLIIPPAGSVLPTTTPIPADLPRGRLVDYRVLPGDTLAGIAVRFNSLADEIVKANDLEDANALQVGQVLKIPVNLVTATATLPSTSTPVTPTVAGQAVTATLSASGTPAALVPTVNASAQCASQENNAYVTELQTLINNKRTSSSLTALNTNTQLAAAALSHAKDMACNYFFSHNSETNGSTPAKRVADAGFTASLVTETIYAAKDATPQKALDWWLAHSADTDSLLNATTTQIGIAYIKADQSLFGGYFVVVMAKP